MKYVNFYDSPLGRIILAADDDGLSGLWFEDQKYFEMGLSENAMAKDTEIFEETMNWLNEYFAGKKVETLPKLSLYGTDFQKRVWDELLNIPYGETVSYGEIAERLNTKSAGFCRINEDEPEIKNLRDESLEIKNSKKISSEAKNLETKNLETKDLKTKNLGYKKISPRAVGGAVGHNHISIIIPCHRVIGADGKLTGYAGGIERKIKLLEIENAEFNK